MIVDLSEDEYQDGDEGCLSVPGLWYPTKRAWYAKVEGIDLDGNPVVVEGTELMARCLQHEVDHLDGTLYVDRMLTRSFMRGETAKARYAGKSSATILSELGIAAP